MFLFRLTQEKRTMLPVAAEKSDAIDSKAEYPKETKDLYARFKEVRTEMERHLHPTTSLIGERDYLGHLICQDREFMSALKADDRKAYYILEDCADKHIHYNPLEKEGISL